MGLFFFCMKSFRSDCASYCNLETMHVYAHDIGFTFESEASVLGPWTLFYHRVWTVIVMLPQLDKNSNTSSQTET